MTYHAPKPGPDGDDGNEGKAEPTRLSKQADEPCPRPDGCKCTWTLLTLGWSHGKKASCPVH